MNNITITSQAIISESNAYKSLDELLDALNSAEGDLADAILDVMPSDYKFIMDDEDYGVLFALGSPQVCECGWKFNYEVAPTHTKLTITNFK
jgi:hypothetical protein